MYVELNYSDFKRIISSIVYFTDVLFGISAVTFLSQRLSQTHSVVGILKGVLILRFIVLFAKLLFTFGFGFFWVSIFLSCKGSRLSHLRKLIDMERLGGLVG